MRGKCVRLTLLLTAVSVALVVPAMAQLRRAPTLTRPPTLTIAKPPATARPAAVYFSTEEDFVTHATTPADGNRIISDGDLLTGTGQVFRRNRELLLAFNVRADLGLDAADVIYVLATTRSSLIAFSTELDDPRGQFTAGDLLATNGAVLPNGALLAAFHVPDKVDLGLDAVHFIGKPDPIKELLDDVKNRGRVYWLQNPNALRATLKRLGVDIWFSTEGTPPPLQKPAFLDGDLLSVNGTIIAPNAVLLPGSVPAGIPDRGVDFGLDAVLSDRSGRREPICFSTEILYQGRPSFTDGDVLRIGNGIVIPHWDLVRPFEPKARFLGLDALSLKAGG